MEWRDDGLIIGVRQYGEASVILEAMTRGHGRHLGLVRGGRSQRMRAVLQPGNSAELVWRARLDEQLGTWAVEPTQLRAATLMASAEALHAVGLICALLRLIAERDPHPDLYETAVLIAGHIGDERLAPLLVRLEIEILRETGFGLDLSRCAATGAREDLAYVSPKSGRAVSLAAGAPYRERLLPLPPFLREEAPDGEPTPQDVLDGFSLTGFFLKRDVFTPRGQGMPEARRAYLAEFSKRQEHFPTE
ncbi:DNA repair protein RecO [Methylocella silvestris]|uniref:DNA repair protein RecO n=1 Tax=Methylocella silvestris TaxID=199596 RepID=A0A2J7TM55_METSI|nr:DNA repair protein RecO [Methylocella silvestris]PNG27856.1 DNA repair protein RecO [Methylocella silvestris]